MVIAEADYQVRIRLTLQLIKRISSVFQKILKYFNGNAILRLSVLPEAAIFKVILVLDLNDSESDEVKQHLLHFCNIALNLRFLHDYHYILINNIYIYKFTSK